MTGTFTQFGCDHCADIMPLLHLYRSQLVPQAEYLNLPQEILSKKADPDVLPGLDDKGALLRSFDIVDQILWCLENEVSLEKSYLNLEKIKFNISKPLLITQPITATHPILYCSGLVP